MVDGGLAVGGGAGGGGKAGGSGRIHRAWESSPEYKNPSTDKPHFMVLLLVIIHNKALTVYWIRG